MSLDSPTTCLICAEKQKVMVSLDQTLSECEDLSVAQVLRNLNILTISDVERRRRVVCCICAAKVNFCYAFITQCYQIEKELEIETINVSDESMETFGSPLLPIDSATIDEDDNLKEYDENLENITKILGEDNATSTPLTIDYSSSNLQVNGDEKLSKEKPDKSFISQTHLNVHEQIPVGNKLYFCRICHKEFNKKKKLKMHQVVHQVERTFDCDVCNQSFSFLCSLRKHKTVIHKVQKPYACDVCNESYQFFPELKAHKIIHSGRKAYVCDVCNRTYLRENSFMKHKLQHV